jgi:poly-gamma-glutamate synthesis protein (capsule biosynthesis protein)
VCAVVLGIVAGYSLSRNAHPVANDAVESGTATSTSPSTVLFVGDMMFDRFIRTKAEKLGYDEILADVAPLLQTYSLVVGNLEGPVTTFQSTSRGTTAGMPGNMRFTFDRASVQALKKVGVGAVTIGNNHIRDFGIEGLVQTRIFLGEAGIQYVGDPDDPAAALVLPIPNVTVSLISYNQFLGQTVTSVVESVRRADAASDIVIVYAHWGDEYADEPSPAQQKAAYQFVDAGADLVIGAHPHVVQEWELYKSRRIYYSLGNFVFDQYFSPETKEGRMLSLSIHPDTKEMVFTEISVYMLPNGKTTLIAPEK